MKQGDLVLFRGKIRLVVDVSRCVIAFEKIGSSWTDPNPLAFYDRHQATYCKIVEPANEYRIRKARRLLKWRAKREYR